MSPKKKQKSKKSSIDPPQKESAATSWLSENLYWAAPTLVTILLTLGVAWWQLHKYVKADLTLTNVQIESDTPGKRVYALKFEIHNSGNLPISIYDATPFVESAAPYQDPIPFLENEKPFIFNEPEVNSGSSGLFTIQAHVPKTFMNTSKQAEVDYAKKGVDLPIKLGVIVYSNDNKYYRAVSEIRVTFIEGRQVSFVRNPRRIEFQQITESELRPIGHKFDEPNERHPT